jgi:ankyrin repeat protein
VAINQLEEGGDLDTVLLLLNHRADVNAWDFGHNVTPLLLAIFNEQLHVVEILLKAGADPNVRNCEGDSPLRVCVEHGHLLTAQLLLKAAATKTVDEWGGLRGLTPLGMAAQKLDLPMLELLLDAGANPHALDEDYKTARERLPEANSLNASLRHMAESLLHQHEDQCPEADPDQSAGKVN